MGLVMVLVRLWREIEAGENGWARGGSEGMDDEKQMKIPWTENSEWKSGRWVVEWWTGGGK